MTVEKACGYIREALEEMGVSAQHCKIDGWFDRDRMSWNRHPAAGYLLCALDSLDPMGTTYKEEG